MIKTLLGPEVQLFLIENAAGVQVIDEGKVYALPVLIQRNDSAIVNKNVVMEYVESETAMFPLANAQKYLDVTLPKELKGRISDGYHTFDELYEHRILNFIFSCSLLLKYNDVMYDRSGKYQVWKSETHSDGSVWDGWFIMGIHSKPGEQITYHLPMSYWEMTKFAQEYDMAPPFDGHTSTDVLERLKKLIAELG